MNQILLLVVALAGMAFAQFSHNTGPIYMEPANSQGGERYENYGQREVKAEIHDIARPVLRGVQIMLNTIFDRLQTKLENKAIMEDAISNCENKYSEVSDTETYKTCLQTYINKAMVLRQVLEVANQPYDFNGRPVSSNSITENTV